MTSTNMMKNTIAFVLTINLVLFGFTVAQPPPPQALTCPIDIRACVDVLQLNVTIIVRSPISRICCPLVAGLDTSVAAVCLCNAVKSNAVIVNALDQLTVNIRFSYLLNACGFIPTGFDCA